jgi:hypothetical protein
MERFRIRKRSMGPGLRRGDTQTLLFQALAPPWMIFPATMKVPSPL